MRRGCLSQGQVKCAKCGQLVPFPQRYLVIDEDEQGQEVEQGGKSVSYCVECAFTKGYARHRQIKGEMIVTFLPDSDTPAL
jgi:ribosomal protein S26